MRSNKLLRVGPFAGRERGPTVLLPGGTSSPHPFCVYFFFFFNVPHISTMLTTALYAFLPMQHFKNTQLWKVFETGKGEGAVLCYLILIAQLAPLHDHREGIKING